MAGESSLLQGKQDDGTKTSQLFSARVRCEYVCQVSFSGNLTSVIWVIHAFIGSRSCWIAFVSDAFLLPSLT